MRSTVAAATADEAPQAWPSTGRRLPAMAAWPPPPPLQLALAKAAGAAVADAACLKGSNSMPVELRNHAPPLLVLNRALVLRPTLHVG